MIFPRRWPHGEGPKFRIPEYHYSANHVAITAQLSMAALKYYKTITIAPQWYYLSTTYKKMFYSKATSAQGKSYKSDTYLLDVTQTKEKIFV